MDDDPDWGPWPFGQPAPFSLGDLIEKSRRAYPPDWLRAYAAYLKMRHALAEAEIERVLSEMPDEGATRAADDKPDLGE